MLITVDVGLMIPFDHPRDQHSDQGRGHKTLNIVEACPLVVSQSLSVF